MDSENWRNFKDNFINTYSFINSEKCKSELSSFQLKCEKIDKNNKNIRRIKIMESINILTREINTLSKEESNLNLLLENLLQKKNPDKTTKKNQKFNIRKNRTLFRFLFSNQHRIYRRKIKIKNSHMLFLNSRSEITAPVCSVKNCIIAYSSINEKIREVLDSSEKFKETDLTSNQEDELENYFHKFYMLCEKYFIKIKNLQNK